MLAAHLKKRMSREQTEAPLGPPDDSPVDGQYRNGSDREEFVAAAGGDLSVYLVLGFRDSKGNVTNELQEWGFAPLGE